MLLCIQPIFKIVTAACLFSPLCSVYIHFCKSSLLMGYQAGLSKGFSQNPAASANRNRQTLRSGKRFELLPRRWVVERTFAWLNRCRRLAKDSKISPKRARFSPLASIRLMLRKLCLS